MKVVVFVAALLGLAAAPTDASLRLRVHILNEKPAGLYEQCEWENKAVKCQTGMFCQMKEKHFGWCQKKNPGLNDQCGGKGTSGPWSMPCSGANLKCVLVSDQYSKCQKKSAREKVAMSKRHKGQDEKVALYGRCKFEDGTKSCASGLQLHEEGGGSCGGQEIRGLWKATCPKGALCRESDSFYSQCLPEAVSHAMDA
ncbi:Small cysteine rich protein SCR108 [Phytophthora megakarya]|uniref:Small cysteine rich protein SCR108 n=1 Tax=Phytophthora megakarya TaxID=4795 RepID=A0A225V3J4_9STRA|nr:Small cysteine rich protein SCR108 [Phytophthora megakarya]